MVTRSTAAPDRPRIGTAAEAAPEAPPGDAMRGPRRKETEDVLTNMPETMARAPHPARDQTAPEAAPPRPVVLVVEDEPAIRLLLCDLLEGAGLDVEEAQDAEGALEILSLLETDRKPCRVLVTDVNLGRGPDGVALAAVARRRIPDLRVVYVTGNPERVPGRGTAPRPRERVLGKPFANAELVTMVRNLTAPAAARD